MAQVLLTAEAEESRIEIWLRVAEASPDAADRLLERIDEKCHLYATQPEMGSSRPDLGRKCDASPSATTSSFTVPSRTASSS